MNPVHCDALIVGGGPAGIAAALALHQRGLDCLLADAATPPIDKACGEGLMPDALAVLSQLGVDLSPVHGAAFDGIGFCNATHAVSASFPSGTGIGVRRLRLHSLLIEAAQRAGVRTSWGRSVSLTSGTSATLGEIPVRFRYLIGADGQTSAIRRHAALEPTVGAPIIRYGFRRHYRVAPWTRNVEIHWAPRSQAYITPVAADELCVAVISRDPGLRLRGDAALVDFPTLQQRLGSSEITSRERGSISVHRRLRRVTRENIALIGDASGSADAITGEGMANSFRQALALADTLANSRPLADYDHAHREIMRLPLRMSRLMLFMDRYPLLQRRALAAFASDPSLFARMLSVHVAHESFAHFLTHSGPRLGARILRPRAAGALTA